jgi:hypothetical protein
MKGIDTQIEQKARASNTRRKFLVRGTATALIASLPVKASWAGGGSASGCMVSGTLSGNQSAVCESVKVKGFSPHKWKNVAKHDRDTERALRGKKWKDVFDGYPVGGDVNKNSDLLKILKKGADVDKHLVAGYLNAESGKYELAPGVSGEQYARYLEEEAMKNQPDLVKALEATYI